jgi:DNA-binding GntR family transcriptional regulator
MDRLATSRPSLTDQAAAAIRRSVAEGSLQAGALYSAHDVAERLGVSRSPVREALLRLAEAGLVSFEEIFELRLLLEVPAARTAARRADPSLDADLRSELAAMDRAAARGEPGLFMRHDRALHARILDAAGNRRLAATVAALREATVVLGASTVARSRDLHDIWAEHAPIVAAVEARDAAAAARAMREHITNTGRLLRDQG